MLDDDSMSDDDDQLDVNYFLLSFVCFLSICFFIRSLIILNILHRFN